MNELGLSAARASPAAPAAQENTNDPTDSPTDA
jgi:hypothetical protein